eukprot:TRINITY_DN1970_c0_g2_i1.p1 TRINITY_DN1970_c0_g2~~TRINITY_DN1970_c0_g2_i1.p1  ORF type:complete len:1236 (+),score=294.30 TRINITY_DN1970_c0_g2_i1:54-3761(+)
MRWGYVVNKISMIMKMLSVILIFLPLVYGIKQRKNISTIYIKGEEETALNLDDYFIGDNMRYEVTKRKYVEVFDNRELLETIHYTMNIDCKYNSSILLHTHKAAHFSSYYLVIKCANNVLAEGMFKYPKSERDTLKLNVTGFFEKFSTCFLMPNIRPNSWTYPTQAFEGDDLKGFYEVIMRCKEKDEENYRTHSSKVPERKYVQWIEEIVDEEYLRQDTMKFFHDKSGVLSEDKFEEKVYRYKVDDDKGVYAYAEVLNLRDYTLQRPFTDFVITKSYYYLIYRNRCLRIYKQAKSDSETILCSDLIFPTDIYKLYHDSEHDPENIYVYSNSNCTIYRVNIRDLAWPYIEYVYKPYDVKDEYEIEVVVTNSFVVCVALKHKTLVSYQVYNKMPGSGQALIAVYRNDEEDYINDIKLLNYDEDMIMEIKEDDLNIVKLRQRMVKISIFGKEVKRTEGFSLSITVLASNSNEKLNVLVDTYVMPYSSVQMYENKEKSRVFDALGNELLELDIYDYFLMSNLTYELKTASEELEVQMLDKLEENTEELHNNTEYSPCTRRRDFVIPMADGNRLEVNEDHFIYYFSVANINAILRRKIILPTPRAIHCMNEQEYTYYIVNNRYLIFLTQVTNEKQYLNILDFTRQNINNYYLIAELNSQRVVNISEYKTSGNMKGARVSFDVLYRGVRIYSFVVQIFNQLSVTLPCPSKDKETYFATFTSNGKEITLRFITYKYNICLTQLKSNASVMHYYKSMNEREVLHVEDFVEGYQVIAFPRVNGSYLPFTNLINVKQHAISIKPRSIHVDDFAAISIATSSRYQVIMLIRTQNDIHHISFYSKISHKPPIKDHPVFHINFEKLLYSFLSIGPFIEYEGSEYLILNTYRDYIPNSVKFVDVKRSKLALRGIDFTFGITDILYNSNTKHLFLLEQPPIDFFNNKVLMKRMDNLNNRINDFEAFIDFKNLTNNSSTISSIEMYAPHNRLFLGVVGFGVYEFEDGEKLRRAREVDLSGKLIKPFKIMNLKYTKVNGSAYLFGNTEKEVFIIDASMVEGGRNEFEFLTSCLKPSMYTISNLTAAKDFIYAIVLTKINPIPFDYNYRIVFYKYNPQSRKLMMKVYLDTIIRPISIHILSKLKDGYYVGIGTSRGLETYRVLIDPVIVLKPSLNYCRISVECQNPSGKKTFEVVYKPVRVEDEVKKDNGRLHFVVGIGLILLIAGVIIAIVLLKRKKAERGESLIDDKKNSC